MPRGSALGMVTQLPSNDETSISKKQLLARLDVCMGGRVAEELIFGKEHVTTGASSDLNTATELAQYMVIPLLHHLVPVYIYIVENIYLISLTSNNSISLQFGLLPLLMLLPQFLLSCVSV